MKRIHFLNKNIVVKPVAWAMAHISWFTMAISPVAIGKEAENVTAQSLKAAMIDLQLNQKMTMKELWEKTKADYPGYAYYEIEELVKSNPNALVPQFQMQTVKGSDGKPVPALTFTENGKTHTIQIYGDSNKFLKFDGVTISESEASQPQKIFQKLMDQDPKLQKQYDEAISKGAKVSAQTLRSEMKSTAKTQNTIGRFSSFHGFPRVTPEMWSSMTPFKRAEFLVQMRVLWTAARKVNFYADKRSPASVPAAPKKQPAKPKKTSSLENIYKLIVGDEAAAQVQVAADKPCGANEIRYFCGGANYFCVKSTENQAAYGQCTKVAASQSTATLTPQKNPIILSKPTQTKPSTLECINAGWITENENNKCSYDFVKEGRSTRYNKTAKKFVEEVTTYCGETKIACNPMVFGYSRKEGSVGKAICIAKTGDKSKNSSVTNNAQKATFFGGPCDVENPLTSETAIQTGALANLKGADKKYLKDDQSRQAQLDAIEADQKKSNYQDTKNFLDSFLASKNQGTLADLFKPEVKWNEQIDDLLVQTQENFEAEIKEAIRICEAKFDDKRQYDPNQEGACDELHRRWLFAEQIISQYREKSCTNPTQYIFSLSDENKNQVSDDNKGLNKTKVSQVSQKGKSYEKYNDKKLCGCGDFDATKKEYKYMFGFNATEEEVKVCTTAPVVPAVAGCPGASTDKEGSNPKVCICNSNKKEFNLDSLTDKKVLPDICGGTECSQVVLDSKGAIKEEDIFYKDNMCVCKNGNKLHKVNDAFSCEKEEEVVGQCKEDRFDAAFASTLTADCLCVDKKATKKAGHPVGKNAPKKVNTGFKAIFTTSKNNSQKDKDNNRWTCDQGPNWWVIGGIAGGVALLMALLHHKKKCPKGTIGSPPNCRTPAGPSCPPGSPGTYPNCNGTCPPGSPGTYPNCNPETCPVGTTGTPPNCVLVVVCQPPKVNVSGTCQCPPADVLACNNQNIPNMPIRYFYQPERCSCDVVGEGGGGDGGGDYGGVGTGQ